MARFGPTPSLDRRLRAPAGIRSRLWWKAALLILTLAITLLLPWWLGGAGTFTAVIAFPLPLLALMVALAVICWNLNAARLRLMLDGRAGRLGQGGALAIEMSSKFALCATPAGSGGVATLLWLLARRGYPPAQASAIFLVDQLADMLFFSLMLGVLVSLSMSGLASWPHQALVEASLAALLLALVVFAVVIVWLPWLLRHVPPPPFVGPGPRRWLVRRLLRCRRTLATTLALPKGVLMAIFALCCLHWLARYSLLYLAVVGVGGGADWAWTFLVQMLAMAASQLSVLPGGAGAAEVSVGALLLPLMAREQAAAAVIVWRLVSYHLYLVAGAPVFVAQVVGWWRTRARS
ncbi:MULTISPECIES: lysylphosphatidylglycerol synthase transmembrane domain-containing protein [unclassified Halomonas]|uniref:lysylphosphatidylglycerol synthase transmembrane domain-containing protein n=1 Tax=unclassified Halomonas TaxID=2609666 RepID=UPI000C956132|nr:MULTISPECIES: lysylphosphatidylglycerol synthase transmembrane domain-containing protein [unclassified Halomonas]MAR72731.1 TIGR00374 family protein [Halomonas sp.]|tara:strand:+ start:4341 stop:5387 length:1047 start_codon:yes stop_codon:yes gene_type:complete